MTRTSAGGAPSRGAPSRGAPSRGAPPAGASVVVDWLAVPLAAVPADDDWLAADERATCAALRLAVRRSSWRHGRWAAKTLLARRLGMAPGAMRELAVRAAPDGAPEPWLRDAPLPLALSLSHRGGTACAAVAPAGVALGCDVERVEPRSDGFVADWLAPPEQALVRGAPPGARALLANLVWSAKESALKALRCGLRADPRPALVTLGGAVAPAPADGVWRPLAVRVDGRTFAGWWRRNGDLVHTLVADPPPHAPDTAP